MAGDGRAGDTAYRELLKAARRATLEGPGGDSGRSSTPSPALPGTGPLALELRVVQDGAVLRPNLAAYGVPFDFVDASEGSALSQLMSQAGGAGGLWAALQQQARERQ